MFKRNELVLAALLLLMGLVGCAGHSPLYTPPEDLDVAVKNHMQTYHAATIGIGIIRDGELVWTRYYGEESPGVPAGPQSMFNTASVNKAITAETALRLASLGRIDLDEPIAPYYVHPDLESDPRHTVLTPRMLLSHQAGFLNWPWLYEDGKLAFVDEPGNGAYHYSGAGFRMFAKFLEAKLEQPFPEIVSDTLLKPLGLSNTTNAHDLAMMMAHIVRPVDERGVFEREHEFDRGYWSAADDLFVSVPDYAKFLIAVMNNDSVTADMARERVQVHTALANSEIWGCGEDAVDPCPSPYGHGIGWFVFGHDQGVVVHHGGNDRSEAAIGYYRPDTRDGGVIFVNSTQGVLLWPHLVDLVDPDAEFQQVFHDVIARFLSNSE